MQVADVVGRWYPMPPLWLEGRAWLELAQLLRDPIYRGEGVPVGHGRMVMLIPGFLAGDRSLNTMRGWLVRNGYRPLRSGIDFNMQSSDLLVERVAARLRKKLPAGKKAVVIGQSRGGTLGVGLAQRYPKLVSQVIALGSPIASPLDIHPATMAGVHVARLVHTLRRGPRDVDAEFDREVLEPAKVPITVLYSKTDGFVYWKACLRADVKNIEVGGSHVGMAVNANAYRAIARALKRQG
jgi:pimeloyl-ACP methyl ester carboxylesterase